MTYTPVWSRTPRLCVEVSPEALYLNCLEKSRCIETVRFPLPSLAFGEAEGMAKPAQEWLRVRHKHLSRLTVVVLANTRQSAFRITQIPQKSGKAMDMAAQEALTAFLETFGADTYVADYAVFPGDRSDTATLFMAALPVALADALVRMCTLWNIDVNHVVRMDTTEHALVRYFGQTSSESLWLMLPQENGLRILTLSGGRPNGVYFISNDPAHREIELERIRQTKPAEHLPERVLLCRPTPVYAWLSAYCAERHIPFEEADIPDSCFAMAVN